MSLPKKEGKGYLEVRRSDEGLLVVGLKEHVNELEHAFTQHGLPCRRGQATPEGMEALLFAPEADAAKVAEVLEAYKTAKGS